MDESTDLQDEAKRKRLETRANNSQNIDGTRAGLAAMGMLAQTLPLLKAQGPTDGAAESKPEKPAEEPPRKRLDARPKNNVYMPGTGPGTGRTAIRIGTKNRDGSFSPVSSTFGSATGPLAQRMPGAQAQNLAAAANRPPVVHHAVINGVSPKAAADAEPDAEPNEETGEARPKRLDARPKNNVYMQGTGPGTGRTAIRIGTNNRDGSFSPVSSTFGSATGPLAQRMPGAQAASIYLTPRPTPAEFVPPSRQPVTRPGGSFPAANTGDPIAGFVPPSQRPVTRPGDSFSPDAGAAASMHDASMPNESARAAVSSAAAGYWQSGPAGTRAISGGYGTGAANVTPNGAARPGAPVLPQAKPSTSLIDGRPSGAVFGGLANSQRRSNAFADPTRPKTAPFGQNKIFPARAKGGPVKAGQPYLVGEEGPEVIVPKESGTVVPNHAIRFAKAAGHAQQNSARDADKAAGAGRKKGSAYMRLRPRPAAYAGGSVGKPR